MKDCSYCGCENADTAARCIQCGTDEFVDAAVGDGLSTSAQKGRMALVRDYPKPIVVVGLWIFYLPGFVANSCAALACLLSGMDFLPGLLWFLISGALAVFCGYALYRSVKNYKIHRARFLRELANDLRSNTAESLDATT